jgi:hypothetical protein
MPRDQISALRRVRAYIGTALRRNGYEKHEQCPLVEEIIETIRHVEDERCDPDLLERIEQRLAAPESFGNSDEGFLLRNAIESMIEPCTRWHRNKVQPLGEEAGLLETRDEIPPHQLAVEEIRRQVREKVDQLPDEVSVAEIIDAKSASPEQRR